MKKLLTAAAFLAAGTALSNAGTPVFSHDLTSETLSDLGTTTVATVILNGSDYQALSGSNFNTHSVLFLFTGSYHYANTATTTSNIGLGFYNDGTDNKSGFWSAYNWRYNSATKSLAQTTNAGTNSGTIFNRSNSQLVDAAATTKVIDKVAVSYGFSSEVSTNYSTIGMAVSVLYADGASKTLSSGINTSWLGSSTNGRMILDFDGYSYDSTYVSSISIMTNSNVLTAESLAASSLAAVPEPSAFGLLAGIGALALVAARRRRK